MTQTIKGDFDSSCPAGGLCHGGTSDVLLKTYILYLAKKMECKVCSTESKGWHMVYWIVNAIFILWLTLFIAEGFVLATIMDKYDHNT